MSNTVLQLPNSVLQLPNSVLQLSAECSAGNLGTLWNVPAQNSERLGSLYGMQAERFLNLERKY